MADEAGKEFKVYTLFAREIRDSEKGEEFELWRTMNEYYYCNDILSVRDYADVCDGDSADKIFALDETFVYDNPENESYFANSDEKSVFFKTYRPLKEGIMVIRCDAPAENGQKPTELSKYTITEIDFYEYGTEKDDLVFVPAKNIFSAEATISNVSGRLQALEMGEINILTGFPGAPWYWIWNAEVQFEHNGIVFFAKQR